MATTTGPDLSFAQTAVEALMDDTCLVLRDVDGVTDATLDLDTGKLVSNSVTARYAGPCLLSGASVNDADGGEDVGGMDVPTQPQKVSLPLSYLRAHPEAEPVIGDVVVMTSSRRDPSVVGTALTVVRVVRKTMTVSRQVVVRAEPDGGVVYLVGTLVLPAGAPVPDGLPAGTLIERA